MILKEFYSAQFGCYSALIIQINCKFDNFEKKSEENFKYKISTQIILLQRLERYGITNNRLN